MKILEKILMKLKSDKKYIIMKNNIKVYYNIKSFNYRNNNFNIVVKISVWNNLEVNTNDELDLKIYSGCTRSLIF
jgi:hypothetical protein